MSDHVIGKIFQNLDENARFAPEPGTITREHLDRIIDLLRGTQVRVVIINVNGKKTNFPSVSWEPYCTGYDPEGGEDQPFLGGVTDPWFSRWAMNMLTLFQQGIDPSGYLFERGRMHGMRVWASMRMNCGYARGQVHHPVSSRFYREHPEYWTTGNTLGPGWNYACTPVRDHFMALACEVLDRFDIDGLELDWLRSPNHFRDGHYAEGARILTEWIAEVRRAVDAAAEKRDHPIVLSARVPTRPEIARGIGLDAVAWARQGSINHLTVGPYSGQGCVTDFDVPVEEWKALLDGTGVPVTVCLNYRFSFYPDAPLPRPMMTREQYRGAAIGALHRGSDGIYIFNQCERQVEEPEFFEDLGAIETLEAKDRDYVQTWASPEVPGQVMIHALPRMVAKEATTVFRVYTGPKPDPGARATVFLTIAEPYRSTYSGLEVTVNGRKTEQQPAGESPLLQGCARVPFLVAPESLAEGYTGIAVRNGSAAEIEIKGVELALRFPSET